MQVSVYNNQDAVAFSETQLERLERIANEALPTVMEHPTHGGGVIADLEEIEISIVDDTTIAQVHVDFMQIEGATDVITFAHGEIVISVETAIQLSKEYGHSYERELALYIIHGLLHLRGHEDAIPEERTAMEKIQFAILDEVFPDVA